MIEQVRRPLGMGRLRVEMTVPGIIPWTAELPHLYDLEVTLHDPEGAAVERSTSGSASAASRSSAPTCSSTASA